MDPFLLSAEDTLLLVISIHNSKCHASFQQLVNESVPWDVLLWGNVLL